MPIGSSKGTLLSMRLPSRLVDALPLSLWRPANLFVGGRLHFCTNGARTVEWNGREIGAGRRPFPFDEVERRWPGERD